MKPTQEELSAFHKAAEDKAGKKIFPKPGILTNYCRVCEMAIMSFSPNQPETICSHCKGDNNGQAIR